MKNKTWVKICSVALSLIMCLSMMTGLFVSAEDVAATNTDSTVGVVNGNSTVTNTAVGATTTTSSTTAGNTTKPTATVPTVPAVEYDTWDGTYDTEWEVAATDGDDNPTAYYITSAEELFGLQKKVKEIGWQGTVAKINAAVAKYEENLAAYNAGTIETAPTFPFVTGTYIKGDYVYHAYSDITFYITANIDMSGHEWNGLGSCSGSAGLFAFKGNIIGWDRDATSAKTVYIKGMKLVASDDVTEDLVLNYKTADGTDATVTLSGGKERVGFISTHSGSKVENLTFVNPTVDVANGITGFVVGGGRSYPSYYTNVHVVDGTITIGGAYNSVGGFIGATDTKNVINNCSVKATINVNAASCGVGGFIGLAKATQTFGNDENSVADGSAADIDINIGCAYSAHLTNAFGAQINGNGAVGGVIGLAETGMEINDLNADVKLTFKTDTASGYKVGLGGYVGFQWKGASSFDNCYLNFTLDCTKSMAQAVGGYVGLVACSSETGSHGTSLNFTNCDADIDIKTSRAYESLFGGYVGWFNDNVGILTITNCAVDGDITLNANATVLGGFVGNAARAGSDQTVKTVKIYDSYSSVNITSSSTTGALTGGFIGMGGAHTIISGCVYDGIITAKASTWGLGGILGQINATGTVNVENCKVVNPNTNGANVTGTGKLEATALVVGSVVKSATLNVDNCTLEGSFVAGANAIRLGSVVGSANTTNFTVKVTDTVANVNITANNGDLTESALLIGETRNSGATVTVDNCIATGTMTSKTAKVEDCAGVFGSSAYSKKNGTLEKSKKYLITNTGVDIDFEAKTYVKTSGGILGYSYATESAVVSGCTADVTATATTYIQNVAGVSGWEAGAFLDIDNCNATVKLTSTTYTINSGGITGYAPAALTDIDGCTADVAINSTTYTSQVGGIYGYGIAAATIDGCNAKMSVTANEYAQSVGGIVGYTTNAMTLNGCETVSMTVTSENGGIYTSGGICGRIDGNAEIKNCTADAKTVTTGDNKTKNYDAVGGIAGYLPGTTVYVYNCEANYIAECSDANTGTKYNSGIGGIVGKVANGTTKTIENCRAFGKISMPEGATQYTHSIGGILGYTTGVGGSVLIKGCYYGGIIDMPVAQRVGGIVGSINDDVVTIENCQMEGVVSTNNTQTGAIVGRYELGTQNTASLSLNDIVISGISAAYNVDHYHAIGTIAVSGDADKAGTITFGNIYSQVSMPIMPFNDFSNVEASDNGTPDDTTDDIAEEKFATTLVVNGDTENAVRATSNNQYASYMTATIAGATLDSTVWTDEGDTTPVLTVAKDADRLWKSADITWFNPYADTENGEVVIADADATTEVVDVTFDTEAKVYGYAMLMNLRMFRASYLNEDYTFTAKTDCLVENVAADKAFYEGTELIPTHYCVHTNGVCKAIAKYTLDVQYQEGTKHVEYADWSTTFEDKVYAYDARILGAVTNDLGYYDRVGFIVTNVNLDKTIVLTTNTVYTSVVANSDAGVESFGAATTFGDEAKYMFAVSFKEIPVDTTFIIQAFADVDGVRLTGAKETLKVTAEGLVKVDN